MPKPPLPSAFLRDETTTNLAAISTRSPDAVAGLLLQCQHCVSRSRGAVKVNEHAGRYVYVSIHTHMYRRNVYICIYVYVHIHVYVQMPWAAKHCCATLLRLPEIRREQASNTARTDQPVNLALRVQASQIQCI